MTQPPELRLPCSHCHTVPLFLSQSPLFSQTTHKCRLGYSFSRPGRALSAGGTCLGLPSFRRVWARLSPHSSFRTIFIARPFSVWRRKKRTGKQLRLGGRGPGGPSPAGSRSAHHAAPRPPRPAPAIGGSERRGALSVWMRATGAAAQAQRRGAGAGGRRCTPSWRRDPCAAEGRAGSAGSRGPARLGAGARGAPRPPAVSLPGPAPAGGRGRGHPPGARGGGCCGSAAPALCALAGPRQVSSGGRWRAPRGRGRPGVCVRVGRAPRPRSGGDRRPEEDGGDAASRNQKLGVRGSAPRDEAQSLSCGDRPGRAERTSCVRWYLKIKSAVGSSGSSCILCENPLKPRSPVELNPRPIVVTWSGARAVSTGQFLVLSHTCVYHLSIQGPFGHPPVDLP